MKGRPMNPGDVEKWNPGVQRACALGTGIVSLVLGACATGGAITADPWEAQLVRGSQAATSRQWEEAGTAFSSLLRHDVRNARLQFLNGLTYDRLGREKDRTLLDLARVGYENAARFAPGDYWARLYLGFLELERGEWSAAQAAFAAAVKERPQRFEALYGLGVASYYAGDSLTARLAAAKAHELQPANADAARLHALALATDGESESAREAANGYKRLLGADVKNAAAFDARFESIVRQVGGTRIAQASAPAELRVADAAAVANDDKQVTIDVTIILSSLLKVENRGVNLFDGLAVQYGGENRLTSNRASGIPYTSTRSITSTITVPTLTYNLNLFNDSGQYYQVIARPTLTAYLERESDFFAGRTVNVSVSGVNLGTLQPIDVGVGLKVTPEVIAGKKITFRVSASRSFLSREEIGTFDESLTTFKQLVSATAEVELGQTLLLSALSESVQDANFSRVPGLGQIPGPNMLFNRRSTANRRESLLILLTPTRPSTIQTTSEGMLRPAALDDLLKFWSQLVDPVSSVEAITKRLGASRFFRGGQTGDVRWNHALTQNLLDEAITENVESARR
jgi:Flp pilus assembly protein TadD